MECPSDVRPNISGKIGPFRMWATKVDPQSGALYAENRGNCGWAQTGGDLTINVQVDASKSDSIYSGSTLQPSSGYVLIIIKA